VWAEYAKDRYEAAEKRLSDFRGWARQLGAAIAVVIGLEAALLSQLSKAEDSTPRLCLLASLVLLGIAIAHQLVLFGRGIGKGYVGQGTLGPESAVLFTEHLPGKSEDEIQRIFGAYFAKSAESVHSVAEGVANEVGVLARNFQRSLWLLFAVLVLVAGMRVHSALERKSMTDTPSSSGPSQPAAAPPSPAPAAATPAPASSATPASSSPLLTTPTTGRIETKAAQPSRETMVATPTPGQRITEGTNKPR
jgi:hypothetical protein